MNDEYTRKLQDGLLQITSATFDKASAYTNLVMFAGYGCFFALWSLLKADLAPIPTAVAAILMAISASTFGLYEVYKMAYTAIAMNGLTDLLDNPGLQYSAAVMVRRMDKYQRRSRELNLSFFKMWKTVLAVCASTGCAAVFIFLATLFHHLFTLLMKAL